MVDIMAVHVLTSNSNGTTYGVPIPSYNPGFEFQTQLTFIDAPTPSILRFIYVTNEGNDCEGFVAADVYVPADADAGGATPRVLCEVTRDFAGDPTYGVRAGRTSVYD
jgi:hypothetical protein